MQNRLKKSMRNPLAFVHCKLNQNSYALLAHVAVSRFLTSPMLGKLLRLSRTAVYDQSQKLWHMGLLNHYEDPATCEYVHYIDEKPTLDLLRSKNILKPTKWMYQEVKTNKAADYANAVAAGNYGSIRFNNHELMISRLRFMSTMLGRFTGGKDRLKYFWQGSELYSSVEIIEHITKYNPEKDCYEELNKTIRLPLRPDALLSLKFSDRKELAHFFYEADRDTMSFTDMKNKMLAYYHAVKKQKKHIQVYGVHPIRSVLIETTDTRRMEKLMQLATEIATTPAQAGLFWFTTSDHFTAPYPLRQGNKTRYAPRYLIDPKVILEPIWQSPADAHRHRLKDLENTPQPVMQTSFEIEEI